MILFTDFSSSKQAKQGFMQPNKSGRDGRRDKNVVMKTVNNNNNNLRDMEGMID